MRQLLLIYKEKCKANKNTISNKYMGSSGLKGLEPNMAFISLLHIKLVSSYIYLLF